MPQSILTSHTEQKNIENFKNNEEKPKQPN